LSTSLPVFDLNQYLQACTKRYTACLDSLPTTKTLSGLVSTARFHYLKLDSNGRPRWLDLARNLATQILFYCFSVQKRSEACTDDEILELRQEAREFFREADRSGEAGEILLYFLQEVILKAPQIVSKISLKSNPQLETFGSDGIHMKWHEKDGKLDLYFGEAKLYGDLASAVNEAVKSILGFHEKGMERFELRMVTRHFKNADGPTKEAVLDYVKTGTAAETVRINHACLLGFNSDAYSRLPHGGEKDLQQIFCDRYQANVDSLKEAIESKFSKFKKKRLRFEVFVLPFTSVDQFRKAFLKAL
jgi:hypothetical protein